MSTLLILIQLISVISPFQQWNVSHQPISYHHPHLDYLPRELQQTQSMDQIIEFSFIVSIRIAIRITQLFACNQAQQQHGLPLFLKQLWTLAVDRIYVFRIAIQIPKLLQLIKTMMHQNKQLCINLDKFLWQLFFSKFPVTVQDYGLFFDELSRNDSVRIITKDPFVKKRFRRPISMFYVSIIERSANQNVSKQEVVQFAKDMIRVADKFGIRVKYYVWTKLFITFEGIVVDSSVKLFCQILFATSIKERKFCDAEMIITKFPQLFVNYTHRFNVILADPSNDNETFLFLITRIIPNHIRPSIETIVTLRNIVAKDRIDVAVFNAILMEDKLSAMIPTMMNHLISTKRLVPNHQTFEILRYLEPEYPVIKQAYDLLLTASNKST